MKSKRTTQEKDPPLLETDSYRIWDGKGLSPKERSLAKKISLEVHPGERVHQVVALSLEGGTTVKALSKERIKDGRIKVLLRFEQPDGKIGVIGSDVWIDRETYDQLVRFLRRTAGDGRVSVICGEDIHVGLAGVLGRAKRERAKKGNQGPEGSLPHAGAPVSDVQGGDNHGG